VLRYCDGAPCKKRGLTIHRLAGYQAI